MIAEVVDVLEALGTRLPFAVHVRISIFVDLSPNLCLKKIYSSMFQITLRFQGMVFFLTGINI